MRQEFDRVDFLRTTVGRLNFKILQSLSPPAVLVHISNGPGNTLRH